MAIITICRGTNSGGKEMAECLAARLRYPILGREVVQKAAARLGVPPDLLEGKMTDHPSLWGRFSAMRWAYIAAVQAALADRVVGGNLVYHGLAGGFLLRGVPCTLTLFLIAPWQRRVRTVMEDSDMDAGSAERYVLSVDAARARWMKVMYGEDRPRPTLFDMVINLESMSIEGACSVVAKTVAQPEFLVTDQGKAGLEDFRTGCQVKVALASDPNLRSMHLDVTAKGGSVVVSGEAPLWKDGRTGNRIIELARTVPDVREVRLSVDWFDPYP